MPTCQANGFKSRKRAIQRENGNVRCDQCEAARRRLVECGGNGNGTMAGTDGKRDNGWQSRRGNGDAERDVDDSDGGEGRDLHREDSECGDEESLGRVELVANEQTVLCICTHRQLFSRYVNENNWRIVWQYWDPWSQNVALALLW